MAQTGIIWTERFLEHDTGSHHPERPARLRSMYDALSRSAVMGRVAIIEPTPVDLKIVERVHAVEYINKFRNVCGEGSSVIDTPDCPICPMSFEIAELAAGGSVNAVDGVMDGTLRNAFCLLRPPGHHAERRSAMGFCFFNNIAVAAEHLRAHHNLNRIAILDWDVHHGNGTQHHFEKDPDALFISIHQHPNTLFPGTGHEWERGAGAGLDATVNIPMMPESEDEDYHRAFEQQILPAIVRFKPEFILVSTGFDPHRRDPLAHINLTTEAFGWMTRQVRVLADQLCQGRLVTFLEGGYELQTLADCTQIHVEMLDQLGPPGTEEWAGPEI